MLLWRWLEVVPLPLLMMMRHCFEVARRLRELMGRMLPWLSCGLCSVCMKRELRC